MSASCSNEAAEGETVMEKAEIKKLDVGQFVRYCSQDRHWHDALVNAVHGEPQVYRLVHEEEERLHYPCINLVFVVANSEQQDQYGRQTMHESSVMHFSGNAASGFFWCHPEDEEAAFKYMSEAMRNIKS